MVGFGVGLVDGLTVGLGVGFGVAEGFGEGVGEGLIVAMGEGNGVGTVYTKGVAAGTGETTTGCGLKLLNHWEKSKLNGFGIHNASVAAAIRFIIIQTDFELYTHLICSYLCIKKNYKQSLQSLSRTVAYFCRRC